MFRDMRPEKQDIILPGYTTCTPKRPQGAHVRNTIFPSPSGYSDTDFLGGSSRKRKLTDVGSPGSTSECSFPWKSNLQEGNPLLRLNGQGNNHGVYLKQPKTVETVNFRHQFDNHLHYQNDFSETRSTFNPNFRRNGIEKMGNPSCNVSSQTLHPEGLTPSVEKMSVGEIHTVLNRQNQASNVFSQTEAQSSLPFLKSYNEDTEKSQLSFDLQDLMSFGTNNYVLPKKMPLEMGSSECLSPVEILHQSFIQQNRFSDGLNGKAYSQEEYSCGLKESGFCSKNEGMDNLPNVATASLGPLVFTKQGEKHRQLGNEVQVGRASLDVCFGDKSESKEGSHGDENFTLKLMTAPPDTEKPDLAFTEDTLSENRGSHDKIIGHGRKNDFALKFDEKNKLPSEKAANTVAEKLWDGSLQLSSSVTLSAVAFFKSGEKLLGNNWPQFVEVKGKVRLEAFEKYIQDLPRSRNRGLMVISLCWKEGSSGTGLTGMKEVARGYKKSARVGYAQISPGIDLYICPRSDTIITILAKYGFFKGMAVIDDNQDSLIGVVVWKKNQTSSNSVGNKNSSSSGQPLNSPSGSSTQEGAEKKFSPTKLGQEPSRPIQPVFVPSSETLESTGENGFGSKNIESSEGHLKIGNSSSGTLSLPIPSLTSNPSSISTGQLTPPNSHLPIPNCVSSRPCNLMKQTVSSAEDDDLPEFDFGIACGISVIPMSKPLNPAMLEKRLPPDGTKNICGPHQTSDNPSLAPLPSAANQGIPPLNKISELQILVSPKGSFEELLSKKKKLFDDDDMPEWCPPELPNQSLAETTRPLTSIPAQNSNPTFHNLPSRPPRPLIPPPSPADTRSAFSYQPLRPAFTITMRAPHQLPFQSGPSSSMGLNSNPALRPHSSNANPPPPFSNGRVPRP